VECKEKFSGGTNVSDLHGWAAASPFVVEKFQGLKGLCHSRFGGPSDAIPERKVHDLAVWLFSLNPEAAL